MADVSDWVVIGRFGRVHGIKGNIIVHSFTEPTDNIQQYMPWHAYINQKWQPIKINRIIVNAKHILAHIDGYETVEQASVLTNVDIGISRDKLQPLTEGEFYWHELVGMQVVNLAHEELGQVDSIMPTGSNDVLVVEGEKRHLIPYLLDQFVIRIDKDKHLITVDWDSDF